MTDRIAIVGIGGIFPDAHDLDTFWENILNGHSAAKEAPANRWTLSASDALSEDTALDRVYSHRACFVEHFKLDLSQYDLDDELADLIPQLDVMNHLAIHAGQQAWQDAKMDTVDRNRVGIIIGNIALPTDSVSQHAQQVIGPAYAASLSNILGKKLDWQHTPTHVLNRYVAGLPGGLLAQTLGLGGGAHTLDAACASSLYALKYACDELQAGRADAMIAGGLSRPDCLYTQMGFSQLHALSKTGVCAPFSDRADGLVVGEGAGMLILKRLDDAIKQGDHIYATIAGIGLSNDITGSIMAPDVEGQGRAMRKAYELAGWKPSDVDHIECHGTGTPVGDNVEFTSLKNLWANQQKRDTPCVIGSVKSNVGHLLTGAGGAGLIKTLLAIKHKTLPPTANFTSPNPKMGIPESPFEVLSHARSWNASENTPRKAAVSAFGFGGINAHVLLEEYVEPKTTIAQSKLPGAGESDEPIAIVGMAGHFGPYNNLDDLRRLFIDGEKQDAMPIGQTWGVALANKSGHVIEDIAIELGRFPIPPLELQDMLPQQLLMLLAAANALKDAGIEETDSPRLDMGVYIGIGLDLNTTNFHLRWELANQAKRWAEQLGVPYSEKWLDDLRDAMNPPLTANRTMGALGGIVASRVARAFKVGGPSFTISSEQTSTLHAITQAVTSLRRGEINSAIVGAVEQGCDVRHVATDSSNTPCCDGAGAVILKRLSDAREDGDVIYAMIDQTSRFGVIDSETAMAVDAMDELGDLGPATSIASTIKAALSLHHRFNLQKKGYWLADQSEEVRQCLIATDSIDGNTASITLCEADVCPTVDLDASDQSTFDITDEISEGKVAFVFPGAGNQFANMGQDLCTKFSHVIEQMHVENDKLKSQFAAGKFWDGTPISEISHKDVIFGQVSLGTMISDIALSLGIKPDAMIGYSLGETTSMFASRSWTTRDEMLDRMNNSSLFTTDLAGPCDAARKTWQLDDDEPVDWVVTVVPRSPQVIRETLEHFDRAYLLIINKPDECVIGGDRLQVRQAVQQLGASWHPVEGVTTVHCEVAHAIRDAYRDLHLMPTDPPADIAFYSGIAGKSYQVTRESIADSIVGQAMEPFDFSKVVEAAYADGVRVFIEMGPGQSCTRLIDQILGDREHLAVSLCREKQDNVATLLKVARTVESMGQEIVLPIAPAIDEKQRKTIHVAATRHRFDIPQPPFVISKQEEHVTEPVMREEVMQESINHATVTPQAETRDDTSRLAQMDNGMVTHAIAAQQAHIATQQTFMRVSQNLNNTMAKAISMYHTAMGNGDFSHVAPMQVQATQQNFQGPALDRNQCMEFAIGSIGKALGVKFAAIDAHPTRVRLPDEPLMLVDRIMEIEGEACSMTSGRVVTEHDIHPGAWYLDGGVIPTCIAVEAGQADLFLSGYLGIDFITKGKAVYRLLDAEVTFHAPLPGAGKTIVYDIHIDEFFRQDDTYLFRFRFDATVDGQLFLTMHKGCAGFFTQDELDAGKGIVLTRLDKKNENGLKTGGFSPLAPMTGEESYATEQVNALRHGNLAACFGDAFANLGLQQAKGLPGANGGRMNLVHRILSMNPDGGRFGLGQIVGEADIHPDDWFITCHFCDDQVMPGTLMYECCLHTLRVYLLRLGWVGEETEFLYEPKPGIPGQLKCRGQVLASTKKVWYEITVKEIGYDETAKPYVIADALMYGDGKPIVQMKNMSLQLSGLSKQALESRWANSTSNVPAVKQLKPTLYDNASIVAFAEGNPSDAFGDRYKVFDNDRKIARLPRAPYKFLDRIVHIEDCEPWKLAAGGVIEAEYDVPADEWYFAQDRQPVMPFAVLLEVALQPCGWLAAYLGSALTSDTDLRFRNLGGDAVQLLPVTPDIGTLTTRIKITNVSQSGGMIIQHFDMHTYADRGDVYKGTTYFGFFTADALANQVGIREAQVYEPTDREFVRTEPFNYPTTAPYPDDMMRMLDRIVVFDPAGGPNGLGIIRGEMDVNPDRWFFQAHFYQDPVCPGSLGLESFLQLLKVYTVDRWGASDQTQFECMAIGEKHKWVYRGQIIPADALVTVQAVIKAVDDATHTIIADGFLIVDGRVIYQMIDFAIRAR
ncbi:MAG: type I polyketide synthase [Phycisphaeraceae bacterium]|nr:type I polyketide synthase [Phycisphaeraceae bacterium]